MYIREVIFSRAMILYVYTDFYGFIFNLCLVVYNIDTQDHDDGAGAADARSGSPDRSFSLGCGAICSSRIDDEKYIGGLSVSAQSTTTNDGSILHGECSGILSAGASVPTSTGFSPLLERMRRK